MKFCKKNWKMLQREVLLLLYPINKKVDKNLLYHLPLLESSQEQYVKWYTYVNSEMYSWFFRNSSRKYIFSAKNDELRKLQSS